MLPRSFCLQDLKHKLKTKDFTSATNQNQDTFHVPSKSVRVPLPRSSTALPLIPRTAWVSFNPFFDDMSSLRPASGLNDRRLPASRTTCGAESTITGQWHRACGKGGWTEILQRQGEMSLYANQRVGVAHCAVRNCLLHEICRGRLSLRTSFAGGSSMEGTQFAFE